MLLLFLGFATLFFGFPQFFRLVLRFCFLLCFLYLTTCFLAQTLTLFPRLIAFLLRFAQFFFKLATLPLEPLPFIFLGFPHGLLFHLAALFFFCCFSLRFSYRVLCLPPLAAIDHNASNDNGRDGSQKEKH
ncbi:MAG: hypothetical protein HY665_08730 [Chloroflexi bacterium]|nr:hypothetical protein [Chloroflexota bacterium]